MQMVAPPRWAPRVDHRPGAAAGRRRVVGRADAGGVRAGAAAAVPGLDGGAGEGAAHGAAGRHRAGAARAPAGTGDGPMVALRADLDALPTADEKNVPYRSTVPNGCHACGHDVHTTILLAAARELAAAGYECVPADVVADVYVLNPCPVTHVADRTSRQLLRAARRPLLGAIEALKRDHGVERGDVTVPGPAQARAQPFRSRTSFVHLVRRIGIHRSAFNFTAP